MNKFKLILLVILCPFLAGAQTKDSLVGVWQDLEVVASGWKNTFLFFKDHSYIFYFNQMDCRKRFVSHSGSWEIKDDALLLAVKEKEIIEGGNLVPSEGSCAGDSMITGGSLKKIILEYPETLELSVSKIYTQYYENVKREAIYIDAAKFWRFAYDPFDLIEQFPKK